MTASASAGTDDDADDGALETAEYQAMKDQLDDVIEMAQYKLSGDGRIRDVEREKVRVKWARCLSYAINTRLRVTNDQTITDLSQRIEELEGDRE